MVSTRPVEARPVRTLTRLWRRASMLLAMRVCASCLISLIIAVFPGGAESADYTGNAVPGPASGQARQRTGMRRGRGRGRRTGSGREAVARGAAGSAAGADQGADRL